MKKMKENFLNKNIYLVGLDEDNSGELGLIDLQSIEGGKEFDTSQPWFLDLLKDIGQE